MRPALPACLAVFLIAALALADFTPRFFQGDSFSYLFTGTGGWIPPDRSWAFGFLAAFVLRNTHAYGALILLQLCALGCMIAALRPFFGASRACFAAASCTLALDPLLELYARFVMSDLLAACMFVAALRGLLAIATQHAARGALLLAAGTIAAIFLRVAYAPIIEATVLVSSAMLLRQLSAGRRLAMGAAAAAPILAVLLLVGANAALFRDRFPNELFVTKLSGVFLAGVFAPALDSADFAQAGIAVVPEELRALDLGNYDKRLGQVWGGPPYTLQLLIGARLGIDQEYTQAVDAAAMRLVAAALLRNPLGILQVYARGAKDYLSPAGWRAHAQSELGLDLALPEKFVDFSKTQFAATLDPQISRMRSPLIRAWLAIDGIYPLLLAAGLLLACFRLARSCLQRAPRSPQAIVLASGLIADLAAAPLYSDYVIPRYVLGAVCLAVALIALETSPWLKRSTKNPLFRANRIAAPDRQPAALQARKRGFSLIS